MEDLSYLLFAATIVVLVWVMWYVASNPDFEKLVTNSPQLISSEDIPFERSFANYIKLPFMYW